jgi:hypothetical protein
MDVHLNGSAQPPSADPGPRSGEGLLAEEAIYDRASYAARQPEAELMCAILRDAVESFQRQFVSTTWRAKRMGEEAEEWFFSDDSDWVFSFLAICAALDLCPEYIRQGIKRWHDPGQKRAVKQRADFAPVAARRGKLKAV